MTNKDWLPASREARLQMANAWETVLPAKKTLWNIPESAIDTLHERAGVLSSFLETPIANRTSYINAGIRNAEKMLVEQMRDMKKRYFYDPPLIDADFILLGLKPKDVVPTYIGIPTGIPVLSITYDKTGRIQLNINVIDSNQPDSRSNYGFKISYGIFSQDQTAPTLAESLHEHRFTRQKKIRFSFNPADKGKIVYFCARCENSKGMEGDWSQIVSTFIN